MTNRPNIKFSIAIICIFILTSLMVSMLAFSTNFSTASAQQKKQVTLTAMLTDLSDAGRWRSLFKPAIQGLRARSS